VAFSKLTEQVGMDRTGLGKGLRTQKSVLYQLSHCQSAHLFAKEIIAICSAGHELLMFLIRLHVTEEKLQNKKPFPWVSRRVDKQARIFPTRNFDEKQHVVRLFKKIFCW